VSIPPDLTEQLWAALWPTYPLLRGNGCYATLHDNGLLIAENIGSLAQMISELAEPMPNTPPSLASRSRFRADKFHRLRPWLPPS
jgi:hypothetical protein